MKLEDQPTVQRMHLKTVNASPPEKESLDAAWLKQLVLDAGADDVGFVEIGRPELDDQRAGALRPGPARRAAAGPTCTGRSARTSHRAGGIP